MSPEDIGLVLDEARRMLAPGGRLCLISLTHGRGPIGKLIDRGWSWLWSKRPKLVGGCRAVDLTDYLSADWRTEHDVVVSSAGISSEVLIALTRCQV